MSERQAKAKRREMRFWLERGLMPELVARQAGVPVRKVRRELAARAREDAAFGRARDAAMATNGGRN